VVVLLDQWIDWDVILNHSRGSGVIPLSRSGARFALAFVPLIHYIFDIFEMVISQ
jgi:hypothetical protein